MAVVAVVEVEWLPATSAFLSVVSSLPSHYMDLNGLGIPKTGNKFDVRTSRRMTCAEDLSQLLKVHCLHALPVCPHGIWIW